MSIKTWNRNAEFGPYDAVFWHATSLANTQRIRDAALIDPSRGTGANGQGFYVCTRKTDYQKAMALRNDNSDHPYLYLLRVRVSNFWRLDPYFSEGFAGMGSEGENSDFIAAMWGPDNTGGCGNKHPNGQHACYEEHLSAQLLTPGWDLPLITLENRATVVRMSGRNPLFIGRPLVKRNSDGWKEMWRWANLPTPPIGGIQAFSPSMHAFVAAAVERGVGARDAIRTTLLWAMEELTFKNQAPLGMISVGSRICVVGAQRFGKTRDTFDVEEDVSLDDVP